MAQESLTGDQFVLTKTATPDETIACTLQKAGDSVTLDPDADLSYETEYTLTVKTGVTDTSGNHLASQKVISFITASDTTPPTVASTVPADGAVQVALNSTIRVTFSEAMAQESLTGDQFVLTKTDTPGETITCNLHKAGNSVTLSPSPALSYETEYTLTVKTGVTDTSGNPLAEEKGITFTTGLEQDTTPPTVQSIKSGGSDVDLVNDTRGYNVAMNQIVVTFSEDMDGNTLTGGENITLTGGPSGHGVTISSITIAATTATLTMSGEFPPSQTEAYTLTIKKEVTDLAGNEMDQDHVVNFYVTEQTIELGPVGKTVPLQMVWVPAGSFLMGSADPGASSDEKPQHPVTFAQGFWLGKYGVTQKQWKAVMGEDHNPSYFQGIHTPAGMDADNLPVEGVAWKRDDPQYSINGAGGFLDTLNTVNGPGFSLPSESQWEYAARGGVENQKYSGSDDPDAVAWYWDNSGGTIHEVGTKASNAWGLHDMSGNVWEWCQDHYHGDYNGAPADGSAWEEADPSRSRVVRGGSWLNHEGFLRSACRFDDSPSSCGNRIGFRLLRQP